ncbi:putative mitochondrial protein [Sesamum angolense]|uniref:Mitochondrial protein n=1 Tax=Sesamum angolense TaxID=2727404 RepID=A0AAE1VZN5_9LAMI|nr:putative mitochondrial protein [Sesamum angolense]
MDKQTFFNKTAQKNCLRIWQNLTQRQTLKLRLHTKKPQPEYDAPEAEILGGDSQALVGLESPCNNREEFDFDEFYELANRVLNGDPASIANLNSLKDRWSRNSRQVRTQLSNRYGYGISDRFEPINRSKIETHGCSSTTQLDLASFPSQEKEPQETPIPQISGPLAKLLGELAESVFKDNRIEGPSRNNQDSSPNLEATPPSTGHDGLPAHTVIYIGNVKLRSNFVDNIAGAFLQSTRKTLHFVPPTRQNGEIIIRPTKEVVDNGSKKWQSTAVGYFLGRRPYFPQLETFARSNWKGLQHVSASSSGFFFFRFNNRIAMEDVIEGGPWLFQGQPIVLQAWEQGMSLRWQKHTQILVWIRLKHLPMEYWTDEGLSTVASGIGTPLYSDGITKDCSRLDFARVCVMLDFNSELPKHLVVISPVLRDGKEDPKRIDVEYEWLPQRCKNCCSLGHVSATYPTNMKKNVAPPIMIFVKKQNSQLVSNQPEQSLRSIEDPRRQPAAGRQPDGGWFMIKLASWNVRGLNGLDHQRAVEQVVRDHKLSFLGLIETRVSQAHVQRTRRHLLNNWSWFEDYSGPAGRIWVTWNPLEVDVEILEVGPQYIHCRAFNKRLHTSLDDSEVCGRAADTSASMADFRNCIRDTGLVQLPFTGCPYTWHNCSEGTRSLWKRLDRMLVNVAWLDVWPSSSYISALPRTSDHSPLILTGTAMYNVVCMLKNLKAVFRRQKKLTGDPTNNVKKAKIFLDKAQALFDKHKEDLFLNLVKCCRHNLLGGSSTHRTLDLGFLRHELKHTITTTEASLLVAPVTHLEVKEAFFAIEVESAPGPDRPISCCNVLYKAITKIIVKRLQRVLPLLIDYSQNAFVPGRSISDNILLAQELLAGYNQVRLPARCMLKVDIQKAYDSVEWDFLLEVLRLFNFPQQFITLIEQCVSTASFSISLNGSIHGFFKGSRGLRQGDPISPYLFVLVMEIWSTLIRHRVQNATQFQYHWKCKELGLINLCFADDVLLFCKAHIPSIQVLTDALSEFAILSGLKVNPAKSQTILSRSVQQERQRIWNMWDSKKAHCLSSI